MKGMLNALKSAENWLIFQLRRSDSLFLIRSKELQENDRMVAGLCWECDNQNPLAKIGLTLANDVYTWTNGKAFNPNTDFSNFGKGFQL